MGVTAAKGVVEEALRRETTFAAIVDFPEPGGPERIMTMRF